MEASRVASRWTIALGLVVAFAWFSPQAATAASLPVWGTVASPNQGSRENVLAGVSIVSPSDVWMVGEYNPGLPPTVTGRRTLAEHWDGSTVQIVSTPNATWSGVDKSTLADVAAVAPSDVWAVGYAEDFGSLKSTTLIEHWDGSRWSQVRSPNPAGSSLPNKLFAVAVASPTDIWAVGEQGFPEQSLILRWNGSRWNPVANPCQAPLQGVSVISATDVWAVGGATTCHFDGTGWSVVPSPQPPSGEAYLLQDVSGAAGNDVWAVGFRVIPQGESETDAPLIEHWNGTAWSVIAIVPRAFVLLGVQDDGPSDAWAVGTDGALPLILHWDGGAWSAVPTPSPGAGQLLDVGASGAADLWSVGWYAPSGSPQQTLVERAPSTTQGQVVGQTNVSGALISWFGPQSGSTETDVSGKYAAAGLLAGTYTFVASAQGCNPASAPLTVTAGQTTVQNFKLVC